MSDVKQSTVMWVIGTVMWGKKHSKIQSYSTLLSIKSFLSDLFKIVTYLMFEYFLFLLTFSEVKPFLTPSDTALVL